MIRQQWGLKESKTITAQSIAVGFFFFFVGFIKISVFGLAASLKHYVRNCQECAQEYMWPVPRCWFLARQCQEVS